MSKPITQIDDPRLVKALAHPLRVQIMGVLERGPSTPKQIAAELGIGLENVSYHVRTLRTYRLIELERTRVVRGTVEHVYRVATRPRITTEVWRDLPQVVREALDQASLGQIVDIVTRAAVQDKLGTPRSQITHHSARLDARGFDEAAQILAEAIDAIGAIERQAAKRLRDRDADVRATVVAMLFDTPEPEKPGKGRRAGARAKKPRGG